LHRTNYANKINLPQIVTVGAQSSGKSSVLEMIIGKDILPRGTGIVTRRPTIIQLFSTAKNTQEYAVFSHRKDHQFVDFSLITEEIRKEMDVGAGTNKGISPVPIVLKIFSPRVVNLSLIDLPGITKIPVGDQPDDIEEKIRNMVLLYIQNPNSLILAISPANHDLANSDSLKIAREVDPEGERTLGVITKMDKADADDQVIQIVEGKVYPLKLGYVGVKCRNPNETQEGLSMKKALLNEKEYFKDHQHFGQFHKRMGIPYLTRRLNEYLVEHVRRCVPLIRQKLDNIIQEKEKERSQYGMIFDFSDSNNSKGALLISIINKYAKYYCDTLKGEFFINRELCGGAKINTLFEEYKREMLKMTPFEGLSDSDISISVRNVCGLNHSLIISDKAFEVLVKKEIERFKTPSYECLNRVFHELKSLCTKITVPELEVMGNAKQAVHKIMEELLKTCLKPTEGMLSNIFRIEQGYINTRHPDFIVQREKLLSRVMIIYR